MSKDNSLNPAWNFCRFIDTAAHPDNFSPGKNPPSTTIDYVPSTTIESPASAVSGGGSSAWMCTSAVKHKNRKNNPMAVVAKIRRRSREERPLVTAAR